MLMTRRKVNIMAKKDNFKIFPPRQKTEVPLFEEEKEHV
jgi:hypothetical protein